MPLGAGPSPRGRFLSPAAATVVFFALQIFLAVTDNKPAARATGAAADTPQAVPVKTRVVAQIRSFDEPRAMAQVPATEAALLELLKREGAVVFLNDEVDVVSTPERQFDAEEVEVITARQATFRR